MGFIGVYWCCVPVIAFQALLTTEELTGQQHLCLPIVLSLLASEHTGASLPHNHCTTAPLSLNGTFSQPQSSLS